MTQQQPPGWYPDPADPTLERYWNGGAWGEARPLGQAKKSRKGWLIAGAVAVVALVGYIVIASIAEGGDKKSDTVAATTTTTTLNAEEQAARQSAALAAAAEESRAAESRAAAARAELAALVDKSTYQATDSRGWQLIAKNPARHIGEKYVIYGRVTQADAATGSTAIRVNTDGAQVDYYDMDINTIAREGAASFSDVVEDDLVTMWVTVQGSESYDTTMGGSMTAPVVEVNIIEVTGQS